jgi:hypothetical protein
MEIFIIPCARENACTGSVNQVEQMPKNRDAGAKMPIKNRILPINRAFSMLFICLEAVGWTIPRTV